MYKNFYETLKEARMRLGQTVVMYDGVPHLVICIVGGYEDDIFRAYIEPTGRPGGMAFENIPMPVGETDETLKTSMELFLKENLSCGVVRKMINSPLFNKFRPFSLGMYQAGDFVYYLERQPTRSTRQGLTTESLTSHRVSLSPSRMPRSLRVTSLEIRNCILGLHPSFPEALQRLSLDSVTPFDRDFALVKGPLDTVFVWYKTAAVGLYSPKSGVLGLHENYGYLKEVCQELDVFSSVEVGD